MKASLRLCLSAAFLFVLTDSQSTTLSWKERIRLQNQVYYDKYVRRIKPTPSDSPASTASENALLSNNVETSNRNSVGSVAAGTSQGDVTVLPNTPAPPRILPTSPPSSARPPPPPSPTVTSARPQPTQPTLSFRSGFNIPASSQPPPSTTAPRSSDAASSPPFPTPVRPATSFSGSSASASAGGGSFSSAGSGSSSSSAIPSASPSSSSAVSSASAASSGSSAGGSVSVAVGVGLGPAPPVRKSPVALLGQVVSGIVRPITSILPAPLGPRGKNPGIVGGLVTGLIDELEGNLRVVYPGTLWCGPGNAAQRKDDVGVFRGTDKCCRAHDSCNDSIGSGMSGHGLTNTGTYTRSHCDCDEAFYSCLKRDGSLISLKVGTTYFNILQPKCFRQMGCVPGSRNTTCTGEWKWFNNRLF